MSKQGIIVTVTAARIAAALLIFFNPVGGILLSILFDFLDGRVFAAYHVMNREEYHKWDKVWDVFGYVVEMIVVLRYGYWWPFALLFVWRIVGYIAFVRTGKSWVFLLCPNIFEVAVLWLFYFYPVPTKQFTISQSTVWWLVILVTVKILQEWDLHWFVPHGGNVWWDRMMRTVFPSKSRMLKYVLSLPVAPKDD